MTSMTSRRAAVLLLLVLLVLLILVGIGVGYILQWWKSG